MNEVLRVDSSYSTAMTKRNPPGIAKIWPSVYFYSRLLRIIYKASRLAKAGRYDGKEWAKSSLDVLELLERIGVQIEISGLAEFGAFDGPCVIIGNHMSMMETLVMPVMIQPMKPVTYVIKESLLTYPVFRHVMRSRNPVAVTRTNPRQDLKTVLEEGAKRLEEGTSIIVFPQTTRTTAFDPAEMTSIGVKLAKKAGVPIVPLALRTDAWMNGRYLKVLGRINVLRKVHFAFGPALRVEGKGNEAQHRITEFITAKLTGWNKGDQCASGHVVNQG
jgi:1-acyl-sn-glycerol-3-phosphate acyltransferase